MAFARSVTLGFFWHFCSYFSTIIALFLLLFVIWPLPSLHPVLGQATVKAFLITIQQGKGAAKAATSRSLPSDVGAVDVALGQAGNIAIGAWGWCNFPGAKNEDGSCTTTGINPIVIGGVPLPKAVSVSIPQIGVVLTIACAAQFFFLLFLTISLKFPSTNGRPSHTKIDVIEKSNGTSELARFRSWLGQLMCQWWFGVVWFAVNEGLVIASLTVTYQGAKEIGGGYTGQVGSGALQLIGVAVLIALQIWFIEVGGLWWTPHHMKSAMSGRKKSSGPSKGGDSRTNAVGTAKEGKEKSSKPSNDKSVSFAT